MSTEPSPSPEPDPELELLQPPLPDVSLHTGDLPAIDMKTGGWVGEEKKRVCGKCADCMACTRAKERK